MNAEIITAYRCNPEWCDEGFHTEVPQLEEGFRILAKPTTEFPSRLEEYASEDGDEAFVPYSTGLVKPWTAYRMECGSWWMSQPKAEQVERCRDCGYMRPVEDDILSGYGDCGCPTLAVVPSSSRDGS